MLIDRIREKAKQRAAPPTQDVGFTGVDGYDPGQPTEYADYLATSNDFFAAANLRAKSVAKLPWVVDRPDGSIATEAAILELLRRPNQHYTANRLKRITELALCVWGQYFWVLERGMSGFGRPREIWPVKPTLMKAVPHPTEFLSGFKLTPPDGGKPIFFAPHEVVWFIQPDPSNEFQPLSPLAAARLAADTASGMMKANRNLFEQGMMGGGFVTPPTDQQAFTLEQAQELERELDKRFRGVSKAHRWAVMTRQFKTDAMAVTPKDAQFVDGMNLTFRHVCRALGVPPPLVGDAEFATLANLRVYERALYEHTIEDEADFIAAEITRQLGPAFNNSVVRMDMTDVVALQEDADSKWNREKEQIELGAIYINEWRESVGRDPVEWGDEPWFPRLVRQPGDEDPLGASEPQRTRIFRDDEYTADEQAFQKEMREIFGRQEAEILRKLRQRNRTLESASLDPFDLPRWTERTRAAVNSRYVAAVEKSILLESGRIEMTAEQIAEALANRSTQAAIEGQVRKFADDVNLTTWKRVQDELITSVRKGESLKQATSRVSHVMDIRKQDARRIAQTEITRASTTGQMAAFTTAGVQGKRWVTVGDDAVRETHRAVNGQVVPVTELFSVGIGRGMGPGQIGVAEEDIGCRCGLEPVGIVKAESVGNGQTRLTEADMELLIGSLVRA